jgi:hypothetical protein
MVSDNNLIRAVARPVQQAVVPAVVGHNPAKQIPPLIQHAKGTLAQRLMVDIDEQLGPIDVGKDASDID